jgi:chorismate mutase
VFVLAEMEGDLGRYAFQTRGAANLFVTKLRESGYLAEVSNEVQNGDESLLQVLSDEIGPSGAKAQMRLFALDEQYDEVLLRRQELCDEIADAKATALGV